ncbi:MAG TPA: ATPase, T2SS/T4P/T4SS family, partial [Candidatus Cybelea sp.]
MTAQPLFPFVGAKGGVGTTTLCCELAKAMRDKGVAIVDADLTGRRSVALLCEALRSLDAARGTSAISRIRGDGMTVVELAHRYDAAFTLDPGAVEICAEDLTGFGAVLVDAPQPFAAAARPFVTRATRIFVVLEPTLLGIAGAQTLLADLLRFGIPEQRIALVCNARAEAASVTRSEIERSLGAKVVAEIPPANQRSYPKSIAGLQRYIQSLPAEDVLTGLQPSAAAPLGETRVPLERTAAPVRPNGHSAITLDPKREAFKQQVHQTLMRQLDLQSAAVAHTDAAKLAELRTKVENITASMASTFKGSAEELATLRQEIVDEALGLGPLEDLMKDPDVTEIMVNGPDTIYVERHGQIERSAKRFTDERQLRLVIERIITPLGRRIDESSPMVDARLTDGSRVNAIIEPVAIDGTTVTVRRFGKHRLTTDDLIDIGAVPRVVMDFLRAAVQSRLNCVVSGG